MINLPIPEEVDYKQQRMVNCENRRFDEQNESVNLCEGIAPNAENKKKNNVFFWVKSKVIGAFTKRWLPSSFFPTYIIVKGVRRVDC